MRKSKHETRDRAVRMLMMLIVSLLACNLISNPSPQIELPMATATTLIEQPTATQAASPDLTAIAEAIATRTPAPDVPDEETIKNWQGEKVILLSDSEGDCLGPLYGTGIYFFHGYDDTGECLPYQDYIGQTGVVTEIRGTGTDTDMVITLDKSEEKIVAETQVGIGGYGWSGLGLLSEMEAAKRLIGQTVWVKKIQVNNGMFRENCQQPSSAVANVRLAQALVGTHVEWGSAFYPIYVYFQTELGQEICWESHKPFDNRFRLSDHGQSQGLYTDDFFFQDPRTLFSEWSEDTWALIEKGEIAIGMTEAMARVACGGDIRETGAILSPSGSASPIYTCILRQISFVVEDGIVTQYVK